MRKLMCKEVTYLAHDHTAGKGKLGPEASQLGSRALALSCHTYCLWQPGLLGVMGGDVLAGAWILGFVHSQ